MIKNKTALFLILSLFIVSTLDLTASFATGYQGYQQLNLPEGAVAHLGKGLIQDVAYSPDGNKLAVACRGGVWIYNAHSGQELALLSRGYSNENQCLFSPDGRTVVTIGRWNRQNGGTNLHLWDTTTWQHKMTLTNNLESAYNALSIALSPDGRTLAAHGEVRGARYNDGRYSILLWDTTTWQHKMTIKDRDIEWESHRSIVFSPDGYTLASVGSNGLKIWNTSIGLPRATLTKSIGFGYPSVAFSPDGRILACAPDDSLQLWDTTTWKLMTTLESSVSASYRPVAFSPDGSTFAATVDEKAYIWNTTTWIRIGVTERQDDVVSLTFSPDSTTLASANRNGTLERFDFAIDTYKTPTIVHNFAREKPVFSPDGNRLATCVESDLAMWNVTTSESTRFIGNWGQLNAVAFSPDGNTLASGGQYGRVIVWDIATKHKTIFEDRAGHVIDSIEYSPDGDTLAAVNWSGKLLLWDTTTGKIKDELTDVKLQNVLDAYSSWIKGFDIKFSPDGRTLASSHYDNSANTVLLWNITTKAVETTFPGTLIGFSRDGSTIAINQDPIIELWDTATGKRKTGFNLGSGRRLVGIAFSPDGSTIATSSRFPRGDTVIGLELWDVASGELRATLSPEPEHQGNIMFSPNGDILASWSTQTGFLLWEVPALSKPSIQTNHFQYPPMYWISGEIGTLHRSTGIKVENLVPDVQNATGLALDVVGRKLYWIEKTSKKTGRIRRASLDGSNVQLVKELTSVPHGIAIDTANGKLYVTNSWGKIQRLNFDGSNFEPNLITGLNSLKYITLDVQGGKVYWTENPGRVRRANLDGSNVETFTTTAGEVGGIAVARGKVYWAEKINESIGVVNYANFNGSNVERLVRSTLVPNVPPSIAIDPEGSKLYWPLYYSDSSSGGIWRVNLNGENNQRLIYGLEMLGPIAIDISPAKIRPTDINEDGKVDQNDLLLVATSLGQSTPANSRVDVNRDGEVNIADLLLVIETFEGVSDAAAPTGKARLTPVDRETVESLIRILQMENDGSPTYQQVLTFLHSLLTAKPPDKTRLLPNFPNPFNPETWVPYHLAESANVTLHIHSVNGALVRTLRLGHQPAGVYQRRSRAAYWDGKNEVGEPVASGIYFYTLTAGDFTTTRKMLIRK